MPDANSPFNLDASLADLAREDFTAFFGQFEPYEVKRDNTRVAMPRLPLDLLGQ